MIPTLLVILLVSFFDLSASDYAQLLHNTMWADFLCHDKQHVRAHTWYQDVISNTALPYPLRSYSLFLSDTEQHSTLLTYKNQLQKFFKDDLTIQRALAVALSYEKKDAEAEQLFLELAERFPTAYEVVLPASQILIRRGDEVQAQALLEKVINSRMQKQIAPVCMVLLAQLYIKNHNADAAHALLTQCVTYQPSYAPAWVALGALEELRQNREGALNAYRIFCSLSPRAMPEIEKRIALLQLSNTATHDFFAKQQTLQQVLVLFAQKKYAEASPVVKKALHAMPEDVHLRAFYIHLLVALERPASAIAQLVTYINEDPHDYRWWGALHLLALNPSSSACAYATLKQVGLQYPQSLWGYFYGADYAMRMGEYRSAHALCAHALALADDEVSRCELYFMQALCGYELHDYTLVQAAIDSGLALNVVHAPLCNLAAYYYAHRGLYEKAEKLIVTCCALEPHNYHYQDTAAFIAYKKNNLPDAEKIFNVLYNAHKTDATIALHAAQMARKQQNFEVARELLAQAENHAYSEYEKRRLQSYLQMGTV